MDYRALYENLVEEAEESGLGGEFVDWEVSINRWRSDPVASALHGWMVENDPEGMAAKPGELIDWEMGNRSDGGGGAQGGGGELVEERRRSRGIACEPGTL